MALLLIKPGARVETIWPTMAVHVSGTLIEVLHGGTVGLVRLDSSRRTYPKRAEDIVPRWPWERGA